MKRQLTGMEMTVIILLAMVALIALYAGRQMSAPRLPAIDSSGLAISSRAEESSTVPDVGIGGEGMAKYEAVVVSGSGVEVIEYFAPRLETAAVEVSAIGSQGQGRYSAVVFNPATGAEIGEWRAPRVSSLNSGASTEGLVQYETVVVSSSGAEIIEYFAPRLETAAAGDEGLAQYEAVVSTGSGVELVEWTAPRVDASTAPGNEALAQYSTVVVGSSGAAEVVEWAAPQAGK